MSDVGRRLVLLTIDSLRRDRTDLLTEATPLLREEFTRFDRCRSHGVATPLAFPGITTGTIAEGEGALPDRRATIAEAVGGHAVGFSNNGHLNRDQGYDRGFASFDVLSLPDERSLLDRLKQFDWLRENRVAQAIYQRIVRVYRNSNQYEGDATVPIPYVVAPNVSAFVRRQLARDDADFVWGHFMDPHSPYHPDTTIGSVPELTTDEFRSLTDRVHDQDAEAVSGPELEQVRQLYDGNVRYMARELGELLDWLADQSWYDKSMVVVTADHGELLGEHGRLSHPWDAEPYDELVDVPLFVKFPGGERAGETIDHLTCHSDCYWTIRERFGDESIPDDSRTLLEDGRREVVSASNTALRLTTGTGTAVRTRDGECRVDSEISDEALERLRERELPACSNLSGRKPGVVDDEREQQLEALGYK